MTHFFHHLSCIVKQQLRLLAKDPAPFTVLFIMPAIAIALFSPALGAILREQGYDTANGIELALPGMTVMFGSLGAAFLGFAIFREHQWQSWDRLIIASPSRTGLLIGQMILPIVLLIGQQALLLIMALLMYDTPMPKYLGYYFIISAAFAINVASIGLLASGFCSSLGQMNAFIHIGALLLAASSGRFIPLNDMPNLLASLCQWSPSYWFSHTQTQLLLNEPISESFSVACVVLITQAIVFIVLALKGFSRDRDRVSWA